MTMHEGWTHEQEMVWALQEQQTDIETLRENHTFEIQRLEAGEQVSAKTRRQVWRLGIAGAIVAVWLGQVAYSTYKALTNSLLLLDVEKIVLLVGITGALVAVLINKVWPDNDEKETNGNG